MTTVVLNTVTRKVEVFSSARDVQARAEIADHKAAADPHPQYLADADLAEIALSGDAGDLIAGTVPDARMPNWTGYNVASKTALEAANVPAPVDGLLLLGYAAAGDGGGALYKRVAAEPSHAGKIQSGGGAWWEIAEAVINARMLGATGDGSTDDRAALKNTFTVALALAAKVWISKGDYLIDSIESTDDALRVALAAGDRLHVECQPGAVILAGPTTWGDLPTATGRNLIEITADDETGDGAAVGPMRELVWEGGELNTNGAPKADLGGLILLHVGHISAVVRGVTFNHNPTEPAVPAGGFVGPESGLGIEEGDTGLTLRKNWTARVENCRFLGAPDAGIYVNNGREIGGLATQDDLVISGCHFDRCNNGIVIKRRARYTRIAFNTFTRGSGGILHGTAGSETDNVGDRSIIIGNVMKYLQGNVLYAKFSNNMLIIGNTILDYRRYVADPTVAVTQVSAGNLAAGIKLEGATSCVIMGNTIGYDQWTRLPNSGDTANKFSVGLYLTFFTGTTPDTDAEDNVFMGNTIQANWQAILVDATSSGNVFSGNTERDHDVASAFNGEDRIEITSGSGANGHFTKYPDGTMTCRHALKADFVDLNRLTAAWTFPAAFSAVDTKFVTATMGARSPTNVLEGLSTTEIRDSQVMLITHSATLQNIDVWSDGVYTTGDFVWLYVRAEGRWYA